MGDYIAFRGKVIIKEEYKELVEMINNGDWNLAANKYLFLKKYLVIKRSTLIPFSKEIIQIRCNEVNSMTKEGELDLQVNYGDWNTDSTYFTNLKGLEWTFITCLKNYADTDHNDQTPIRAFMDIVLSEVVNEIIKIEKYDPEYDVPIEYEFEKPKVKSNENPFFRWLFAGRNRKDTSGTKSKKIVKVF
ncbi:hypothetical protein F8158_27885 [Bacillus cereus]|uniref:Group-specific protein n=1 Tax=Bacillus cereus TaxID=1396 RepID=A0AB34D1W5_BACCE|nr:hypothetical protein [Bacillus cereus]KAB2491125.1 hypothetical protein F8158_27885 [Bacillus cereus]